MTSTGSFVRFNEVIQHSAHFCANVLIAVNSMSSQEDFSETLSGAGGPWGSGNACSAAAPWLQTFNWFFV